MAKVPRPGDAAGLIPDAEAINFRAAFCAEVSRGIALVQVLAVGEGLAAPQHLHVEVLRAAEQFRHRAAVAIARQHPQGQPGAHRRQPAEQQPRLLAMRALGQLRSIKAGQPDHQGAAGFAHADRVAISDRQHRGWRQRRHGQEQRQQGFHQSLCRRAIAHSDRQAEAMAAKRTLNARNLEALGAPALAELLMEVSAGHAVIQRRLRLALAAAAGAEGAAQEVRKRLAAIARSSTFIDSGRRKALLADLEAQLQAISGPIAAADAALALELLVRFLSLAEGVLDRSSDSTGAVIGVFARAQGALLPLAAAAAISPRALAEHAAELLQENGYGQFDGLIPALAEQLGSEGLRLLEDALLERGGIDRLALEQIARGRGDLNAYLALFNASQLSWPGTAAEVAGHLLAAGRAEQALAVLDQASTASQSMEAGPWHATRLAALESLGRTDEAQQHRWLQFSRTLAIPPLRDYLQQLDDFADVEAEESAFALVEQHPVPLAALRFLVSWPHLPRAARYVVAHCQAWDGEAYDILEPAADRLSADHPLAASLLLRSMVVFALSMARSARYRYAADHLRQCERLEARIDDWQGFESQASFSGRLREAFAQRRSFWSLLER